MSAKNHCLQILDKVIDDLRANALDSKKSEHLVMNAHSLSVMQALRERIVKEVSDDSR
jgi:hypothetical protein